MRYPKNTYPIDRFIYYKDRLFWKVKQEVKYGGHTINGKTVQVENRYVIIGTYPLKCFALLKIKSMATPTSEILRGADRKLIN